MHIQDPEQKRWLQDRMEPAANQLEARTGARLRILKRLIQAEEFEHFLQSRFVGQKRFALEGAETAIAILDEIGARRQRERPRNRDRHGASRPAERAGQHHRQADDADFLANSRANIDPASVQGSGDVKYHLGASGIRTIDQGKEIVVSVAPNPSHLEAVDPVVEGIVRPKQDRLGRHRARARDPAADPRRCGVRGPGRRGRDMNLSQLDGYYTGGTIHLVINNQIGFTTLPDEARSTPYSTDVARWFRRRSST